MFVRGVPVLVAAGTLLGVVAPALADDGAVPGVPTVDALASVGLDCGFRSDANSDPTLAGDDDDGGWLIAVLTVPANLAARI
jgi:hypothetical protein